jgi:hypothetical protein
MVLLGYNLIQIYLQDVQGFREMIRFGPPTMNRKAIKYKTLGDKGW